MVQFTPDVPRVIVAFSGHHPSIVNLPRQFKRVPSESFKYLDYESHGILDDDNEEKPKIFPFGLHWVQHWLELIRSHYKVNFKKVALATDLCH